MSMSAHVTTMRRQDRNQDEQRELPDKFAKNSSSGHVSKRDEGLTAALSSTNQRAESKGKILTFTKLDNRREAFPVHQLSSNVNPLDTTEASTYVFHRPGIHVIETKCARVSSRSHQDGSNVVLPILNTVRTFPSY